MASAPLVNLLDGFSSVRIVVLGDVMLDRFVYGDVTRISPESPVPVLAVQRETRMPGGAGNVVANLRGLGVQADLISVTGDDAAGRELKTLLQQSGANADGLVIASDRPTTSKTRFLGHSQHMLRVDEERALPLSADREDAVLTALRTHLKKAGLLILSDYGKGVLTDRVLRDAIATAEERGIPVLVDPKGRDFSRYRGATLLTPNRKELADATGCKLPLIDSEVESAAKMLLETSGVHSLLVTRSEQGMSLFEPGLPPAHFPTTALEVFDVSGAGDTVMATLAAAMACGAGLPAAAQLANIAAGIVVARAGTAAISIADLRDRLLIDAVAPGPLDWDRAAEQVRRWQQDGLKVGFTNGCFDILHAGHVNYLNEARRLCDRLVVALNHDASVRLLKGPARPVNSEGDRATVLAGLKAVDQVVFFGALREGEDNTPRALIEKLRPDIYVKGGDYTAEALPETPLVHSYGGEVRIMELTPGRSTTRTIESLRQSNK